MFIIHHIIKSSIPTIKKIFGIFFFLLKQVKKRQFIAAVKKLLLRVLRPHKQLTHTDSEALSGCKPQCKHNSI